jgi:nucleotide-binding universal stress UspA family protein
VIAQPAEPAVTTVTTETGYAPVDVPRSPEVVHPVVPVEPATIRCILVPVDNSRFSHTALEPAELLARRLGAELVLVQSVIPAPIPEISPYLALRLGETDAHVSLVQTAKKLRRSGLSVRELVVTSTATEQTTAAHAILTAASEVGADLIVMATHGRTGFRRAVLGSIADEVLRQSTVPVLMLRPASGERALDASRPTLEAPGLPAPTLVVALDGSEEAEATLGPAATVAAALGAEVELVRMVPESPLRSDDRRSRPDDDGTIGQARHYLEQVARRLRSSVAPPLIVHTTTGGARPGEIASALVERARRSGACMIVVGTRGRHGFSRFIHGSVASDVIGRSELPVLIVPWRTAWMR